MISNLKNNKKNVNLFFFFSGTGLNCSDIDAAQVLKNFFFFFFFFFFFAKAQCQNKFYNHNYYNYKHSYVMTNFLNYIRIFLKSIISRIKLTNKSQIVTHLQVSLF